MLVSPEDLSQTELYPEIIKKIVREDEEEAGVQIAAAESLVKGFMSKYDLNAIFGTDTEPATFIDEHIKKVVKMIASYYLVKKANPNVNIELYRADFEWALNWLVDLQAGQVDPKLPYAPIDPDNPEGANGDAWWNSNKKRTNYF